MWGIFVVFKCEAILLSDNQDGILLVVLTLHVIRNRFRIACLQYKQLLIEFLKCKKKNYDYISQMHIIT